MAGRTRHQGKGSIEPVPLLLSGVPPAARRRRQPDRMNLQRFSWQSRPIMRTTNTFLLPHARLRRRCRWSSSCTWFSPRFARAGDHHDPIVTAISEAIQNSPQHTWGSSLRKVLPGLKPFHVTSLILSNPFSLPAPTILRFFKWVSSQAGFRLTLQSYCYMAHFLCAHDMASEALALVQFIVSRKGKGSVPSVLGAILETKGAIKQPDHHLMMFDVLLGVYVDSGFTSDAIHCARLLGRFGYQIPFRSCRRLLELLLKSDDAVSASWDFYLDILDCGFPPNIHVFNKFMCCFCKDGRVREAHLVFHEIGRRGIFHTVVSYNTLIDGYCKGGNVVIGLSLKQNMLKRGILPDVFTCSIFINALCKESRMDEAHDMYEQMRSGGLVPNAVVFTTLIDGHCKAGKAESVMAVFRDMLEKGLKPDLVTYNAVVKGLSRAGDMKGARGVINEMKHRSGLAPDKVTYTTLLDGYCKEGDIPAAFEIKNLMVRESIKLDNVAYTALITGLARETQVTEAEKLLKEMIRLGFRPDDATYTLVIHGYCRKGDIKRGFKLFKEMRARGFTPNIVTYNVVLNGFCKLGQMKNAQMFLNAMLNIGVEPDDVTYNILLEGHQRSRQAVDVEKIRSEKCLISDFAAYTYLVKEATKKSKNEGMKES